MSLLLTSHSAHYEPPVKSVDAPLKAKGDLDVNIEAGHVFSEDSLSNQPRVHITGKKYWPVMEMLRYHWLAVLLQFTWEFW